MWKWSVAIATGSSVPEKSSSDMLRLRLQLKVNQNKELELKEYLENEKCLGIFFIDKPRDDGLPSIFLHHEECWDLCGHSCPNLPDYRRSPPSDFDPYDEGVLPDLNTYEPTLHTTMSMMVLGDFTEKRCYPDWATAEKIVKKFSKAT